MNMKPDKYRDRLLSDKLKRVYDVLVKYNSDSKSFKNDIVKSLNGAFRFGVYSTVKDLIKIKNNKHGKD